MKKIIGARKKGENIILAFDMQDGFEEYIVFQEGRGFSFCLDKQDDWDTGEPIDVIPDWITEITSHPTLLEVAEDICRKSDFDIPCCIISPEGYFQTGETFVKGMGTKYNFDGTYYGAIELYGQIFVPERINLFYGDPGCGKSVLIDRIFSMYESVAPDDDSDDVNQYSVERFIDDLNYGEKTPLITGNSRSYDAIAHIVWNINWGFTHPKHWVFLDDVDAGLHPRLQRKIARTLLLNFPTLTFWCTSNSPIFISELPSCFIYEIVVEDGERTICNIDRGTLGADVDSVERAMSGRENASYWAGRVNEFELIKARMPKTQAGYDRIKEVGDELVSDLRTWGETQSNDIFINVDVSLARRRIFDIQDAAPVD
jgi:hypothetical protein